MRARMNIFATFGVSTFCRHARFYFFTFNRHIAPLQYRNTDFVLPSADMPPASKSKKAQQKTLLSAGGGLLRRPAGAAHREWRCALGLPSPRNDPQNCLPRSVDGARGEASGDLEQAAPTAASHAPELGFAARRRLALTSSRPFLFCCMWSKVTCTLTTSRK